ncbi:somatostatin-1A-like [Callorhinchus milii]|uniref:Somatostatin 1, tandem duplicate 1 n=2 Tax=Chimaeriformes TaxID=7864 RepID=A0A4W3GY28_CALMI|nr:somatostatin-1A-like [Callorhinchus milii]|eukprot:gi/632987064/ref/XP_007910586.1/ PREDICTED: somatostatin-1A-like [Callorhinchus milii]
MSCGRVQCALALLSIALTVLSVTSAPAHDRYREILQRSLAAAGARSKPELTKYSLAQLLAELANAENEALEAEDMARATAQDEVRVELERSANPNLAQRERKAGCKSFFWKTFTSC